MLFNAEHMTKHYIFAVQNYGDKYILFLIEGASFADEAPFFIQELVNNLAEIYILYLLYKRKRLIKCRYE